MESSIAVAHNEVCLSCREREILTLVAEGATDNEIAHHLSQDDNFTWYAVESENFESIHNHSAYAYIESK
jgi:FixJ family two-component response regulator